MATTRRLVADIAGHRATRSIVPGIDELTARECEVVLAVARGLANAEIAVEPYLGEPTVKPHVSEALRQDRLPRPRAARGRSLRIGTPDTGLRPAARCCQTPTRMNPAGWPEGDSPGEVLAHRRQQLPEVTPIRWSENLVPKPAGTERAGPQLSWGRPVYHAVMMMRVGSAALIAAFLVAGCSQGDTAVLVANDAPPSDVIVAYLHDLRSGDCEAAHALATSTFTRGRGELCGDLTVKAFTPPGEPAVPRVGEVVFATTLTTQGGDASLPDGDHTWFYTLHKQAGGEWRIIGGGSGP